MAGWVPVSVLVGGAVAPLPVLVGHDVVEPDPAQLGPPRCSGTRRSIGPSRHATPVYPPRT